jgi:hypothetical protein
MSFLKSKHSGWSADGRRTPYMGGGGGGGQPTQTTSYNTNVPEYARPYVETMLGATQKQLFDMDDTGITGFKSYTPYSTDVNQYFAGFSPLQQQAQQSAYNMQTPGQYGVASGLAGASGLGAFGLGTQAAGAGSQFAQQAQDPNAMQGYMSPYMQNVVDFQKQSALRDFQVAQPMRQAEAVAKGAFGGSRQAIVDAEAQRNLNTQLQGITATGTQKAFEDAQKQQQFGAQLGLQGLQTGLQGYGQAGQAASTLGQLGTAQFGAQKDITNLQSTMGAQQQALEQNKINQAIQDYAIQQQYPMMQLGFMSNMLRGLPMQAQTTQLYQAQPSALQQGVGLLGAGASLMGAGRAEGGVINMAEGGIAEYKYGGALTEPKLESMADNLSVAQLQERIKDPALTPGERQIFQEALAAKQQIAARSQGIAAAGGGLFNTMGYAGGGILAFADEGLVNSGIDPETGEPYKSVNPFDIGRFARKGQSIEEYYKEKPKGKEPTEADRKAQAQMEVQDIEGSSAKMPTVAKAGPAGPSAGGQASKPSSAQADETSGLSSILAGLRKEGPQGGLGSDYLDKLKALESGADQRMSRADKIAMAKGFLKFGSTAAPGGIGQAAVAGLSEYTDQYGKAIESDEKFRMENAKLQSDIQNLRRAEERGDVKLAAELQEKIADRANRLQTANISAAASGRAGVRDDAYIKQLMAQGMSLEQALQAVKGAGRAEANDIARIAKADAALAGDTNYLRYSMSKKPEDQAKAEQIKAQKYREYGIGVGGSQTMAVGSGNLVQNKDGSFNYVPK